MHDQRWYQSLDQIQKDLSTAQDPAPSIVTANLPPPIPIARQWIAYCDVWFRDRFFPLDGHWMVRWNDSSPEVSLSLWLVQELPRRGAYTSLSAREPMPREGLVGRFLLQCTFDHAWQVVWVSADNGPGPFVVATVTLDAVGLIAVTEKAGWQDVVFAAIHAIPPTHWGNPRVLQRAVHKQWRNTLIWLVVGESLFLLFPSFLFFLFRSQHSTTMQGFVEEIVGLSQVMGGIAAIIWPITILVDHFQKAALYEKQKPADRSGSRPDDPPLPSVKPR